MGELSVKWSWMAFKSLGGVVSKDMCMVSAISCERLFVISMRIGAQSWTYLLCSGVPSGGGVAGTKRVLSIVNDGCVLEGLVPEGIPDWCRGGSLL